MIVDAETAIWLSDLIVQSLHGLERGPGLTIEIIGSPHLWTQLIPCFAFEEEPKLTGFVLNFPYRDKSGNPLEVIEQAGITPPPGTTPGDWENRKNAAIHLRRDIPLVALAHFIGDIFEKVLGASPDDELSVQIDYGY
nr:hypothetical protein [Anaerolineae bacterium]